MNKPIADIVLDILNIIEYPDDKAQFIDDFLSEMTTYALLAVTKKLPEELRKKADLTSKDFTGITEEDIEKAKQYISEEDFNREVERISKEEIKKMITLLSDLDDGQKQKLDTVVASLDEAPAASAPQQVAPAPEAPVATQEVSTPAVAPETPQETPTQQ